MKSIVDGALTKTFGKAGAAEPVDILKVVDNLAYLRIHANAYTIVTSALSLTHTFEGSPCSLRVIKASPFLSSLAVPRFLPLATYEVL